MKCVFSRAIGLLLFSTTGLVPLTAQTPPPGAIVVNARLVVLDVSVLDQSGKPVTGLSANDFRVYEDNQPQTIRNFEPPSAHTLPPSSLSAATIFDPAQPASFGQSPVTVLVLDQLNTHFADSSFARRSLHDYLAKQPEVLPRPTTLLTVYENRFQPLQAFTRDRNLLLHVLEGATVKNAWTLETSGNADYGPTERLEQSLHAVEQIAESYARIPGRKDLVWVGGGFPSIDPTEFDSHDLQIVQSTLQHIINVLLDARVTMYAVDPSSSAAGMVEITNVDQADAASAIGGSLGTNAGSFDANQDFDRVSAMTGGRVVRGRNDVAQQIAAAVDLSANFYTISYSPTSSSTASAKYREIRVDCLRPGLTVVTRAGYYNESSAPAKSPETVAYDLATAAESKLPLNGLHVTVAPASPAAEVPGMFLVGVRAPDLIWKRQDDGKSAASVYVLAVLYDSKGKVLNQLDHPMVATAKPDADLSSETQAATFSFAVPRSPKAARLRFVVRDSATGRMGSLDLSVEQHAPENRP